MKWDGLFSRPHMQKQMYLPSTYLLPLFQFFNIYFTFEFVSNIVKILRLIILFDDNAESKSSFGSGHTVLWFPYNRIWKEEEEYWCKTVSFILTLHFTCIAVAAYTSFPMLILNKRERKLLHNIVDSKHANIEHCKIWSYTFDVWIGALSNSAKFIFNRYIHPPEYPP